MEKKVIAGYAVSFLIIFSAIAFVYFFAGNFSGYAIYEQKNESDFDEGTYNNTSWNGSAVVLVGTNLTGDYVSKVFDAGADATWNNLSYNFKLSVFNDLYCVDGGGEIYKSEDLGINWFMTKENYGRTTATTDMFSNSGYLFILSSNGNEVWRSSDGASFSVVNDSFSSDSPLKGKSDSGGDLYIATAPGEVYKSTDNGVTWSFQGDINPGTNDPKGIAINSSDDLFAVDGAGDVYSSVDDGVTWVLINEGYGGGSGTDDMEIDSNDNLYILLNKKIYKSTNNGVTWIIINESFTSYSNDGLEMLIDSNDNCYILDAVGRVFKSIDGCISWTEIGDCNNEATNDPKGFANFLQITNLSFQVKNCSLADCSDGAWQSVDLDNINLIGRYFQYKVLFSTPDSSITPELYNVSIDYTVLNTAPSISIVSPQDGSAYGYNVSIELNYTVSDTDDNLQACWYNLDGGANISLTCGQNTTFNTSDGSHIVYIYANDTQGEIGSDSSDFSVSVGAPTISLSSPIDIYLNSGTNVDFNYTANDIDLASCELWGNFNGSFMLNQTDNSPNNYSESHFYLNLSDGTYLWNIWCNDTAGHSSANGNQSFVIDTIIPSAILFEPYGDKTTKSITAEWNITEANIGSCWYNVYRGLNLEIANTTVACGANSTDFVVTVDADFTFNFYLNDSAGNLNSTSSNFSVDTSSPIQPSSGGGGGRGITTQQEIAEVSLTDLSNIIAAPGETKTLSLEAKNTGNVFLNKCELGFFSKIAAWLSSDDIKNLAPGESGDFMFSLDIPDTTESAVYDVTISLVCEETTNNIDFSIEILREKLGLNIINVETIRGRMDILYNLEELAGQSQDVNVEFLVINDENKEIAEYMEQVSLQANEKNQFNASIGLPTDTKGEVVLIINAKSDIASVSAQQNIIISDRGFGGLAIFAEGNRAKLSIGILIFLFLIILFFVVYEGIKAGKYSKLRKGIVKIEKIEKGDREGTRKKLRKNV